LLETSSRYEKELGQTERQLTQVNNKLTRLYVVLESGKLDLDDLAPRIKELRAYQHELQQRRDYLLSKIDTKSPETLDADTVMSYVKELEQVLGQASFLQQKTFLRSFIKRVEVNHGTVTLDYSIPLPLEKNRTSSREVLYIDRNGSGGWIRTNDLRVMSPTSFHCSTPRQPSSTILFSPFSIACGYRGVKKRHCLKSSIFKSGYQELGHLLRNLCLISLPEVIGTGDSFIFLLSSVIPDILASLLRRY
jgi:hypothetical protein